MLVLAPPGSPFLVIRIHHRVAPLDIVGAPERSRFWKIVGRGGRRGAAAADEEAPEEARPPTAGGRQDFQGFRALPFFPPTVTVNGL